MKQSHILIYKKSVAKKPTSILLALGLLLSVCATLVGIQSASGLSVTVPDNGTNIIDYLIEFENFKIPKCECGKNCKYMTGINFRKTCGDEKCKTNIKKKIEITDETKEILRKKKT